MKFISTYIETADFFQHRDNSGFTCVVCYYGGRVVRYRNWLPLTVSRYLCENAAYVPETEWERELVFALTGGVCHPEFSWESMHSDDEELPF